MSKSSSFRADASAADDPLLIEDHEYGGVSGFTVVVERVVGEVSLSGGGYESPHHAALSVIGKSGEEGRFTFPNENGGRTIVEVTFPLREDLS